MVASYETIEAVYNAMKRHCGHDQIEKIIDDLLQITGNKSFRDTIRRLAGRDTRVESDRLTQPTTQAIPASQVEYNRVRDLARCANFALRTVACPGGRPIIKGLICPHCDIDPTEGDCGGVKDFKKKGKR